MAKYNLNGTATSPTKPANTSIAKPKTPFDATTAGVAVNTVKGLPKALQSVWQKIVQSTAPGFEQIKFPGQNTSRPQEQPDNIIANTITGIPAAARTVAKEVVQGTARSAASVGLGVQNATAGKIPAVGYKPEIAAPKDPNTPAGRFHTFLFGNNNVKDLAFNVAQTEDEIKSSPTAKKFGLDKAAFPLAFGGVIGSAVLDLVPGGSGEKNVIKILAKEAEEAGVLKILKSLGVEEVIAKNFSQELAKATTEAEVKDILTNVKAVHGQKVFSKYLAGGADEAAPKSAEQFIQDTPQKFPKSGGVRASQQADPSIALAEEARKYKSAEEFVKAQQPLISIPQIKNKYPKLEFGIYENADQITLDKIIVPKSERGGGIGTQAMEDLVEYADQSGKRIVLTPSKDYGASSVSRLTDFYKRFGFVENKGRSRDFSTRESMIRDPKSQLTDIYNKVVKETASEDPRQALDILENGIDNLSATIETSPAKELWDRIRRYVKVIKNESGPVISSDLTELLNRTIRNPNAPESLKRLDSFIESLGYKDLDDAQAGLQQWLTQRSQLDNLKKERGVFLNEVRSTQNDIPQELSAPVQRAVDQSIEPMTQPRVSRKVIEERRQIRDRQQAQEMIQNLADEKSIDNPRNRNLQSLEQVAEQKLREVDQQYGVNGRPLIDMVKEMQTPVTKKVNLLDYIRTPDRVLNKIGLGDEAKLLRKQYDKYLDELPKNIEKITEWSKRVPGRASNLKIFQYLDGKPAIFLSKEEMKVAKEIRSWLAEWATKLDLPVDNRIGHYITHIFEDGLIKKEFDEDLAKIIADKVPGSVYDPFLQKRLGSLGYVEDTWRALDAYVKRATRKVNMDPALAKLEEASGSLEESQWKYVKRLGDRINLRPTEADNLIDNVVKSIPAIKYRVGQRPVAAVSRLMRKMVYRATLGGNIGSALKNLSQGLNTYAKLGEKYTAIGYMKLLSKYGSKELEDVGILRNSFIQDRTMNAAGKFWEKFDKGLFFLFEQAEKINRGAAYYGAKSKALSKGMSEEAAVEYAKKLVRDTQFQFGAVDTPVALQSDLIKTLLQFQSFTVKQTEFLAEMAKNKEYAGILRYVLGGLVFAYTIGKTFGMEPRDLVPTFRLGTPPALKLPLDAISAVTGSKDQYGNSKSFKSRGQQLLNDALLFVPGSVQARKFLKGQIVEGKKEEKKKKVKYQL